MKLLIDFARGLMYKKILFIIIFAVLTLPALVSCSDLDPKTVNALAIIYGNTANRNATTTQSYEAAIPFIKETVYGGYIAVISGDGKPEVIRNFEFKTDANSDYILDKRKTNYTNTVVKFLKSDFTRAKMPEIDLLKAIDEAKKCKETGEAKTILFGLSGHGHFDMGSYISYLDGSMQDYSPTDEEIEKGLATLPKF